MTVNQISPISGYFPPPPKPAKELADLLTELEFYFTQSQGGEPDPSIIKAIASQIFADFRILMNDPSFKDNKQCQALFEQFKSAFGDSGSPAEVEKFYEALKDGTASKFITDVAKYIEDIDRGHGIIHK